MMAGFFRNNHMNFLINLFKKGILIFNLFCINLNIIKSSSFMDLVINNVMKQNTSKIIAVNINDIKLGKKLNNFIK